MQYKTIIQIHFPLVDQISCVLAQSRTGKMITKEKKHIVYTQTNIHLHHGTINMAVDGPNCKHKPHQTVHI